jgi:hypothetical protein
MSRYRDLAEQLAAVHRFGSTTGKAYLPLRLPGAERVGVRWGTPERPPAPTSPSPSPRDGSPPSPPSGRRGESGCVLELSRLVEAFVFEGFFGLLLFALVFGASGFAAPEANPVFGRATLVFGALALLLVLVEIDDHRLGRSSLGAFIH